MANSRQFEFTLKNVYLLISFYYKLLGIDHF
jgi:hypothetical protein